MHRSNELKIIVYRVGIRYKCRNRKELVRAILKTGEICTSEEIEYYLVQCKECFMWMNLITNDHLKTSSHDTKNLDEYRRKYPNESVVSKYLSKRRSVLSSGNVGENAPRFNGIVGYFVPCKKCGKVRRFNSYMLKEASKYSSICCSLSCSSSLRAGRMSPRYRKPVSQKTRKLMSIANERQKKENPQKYLKDRSRGGSLACLASLKKIAKSRSENIWEGVPFYSKEEMECAKILLDNPIRGKNCHIRIQYKEIDFFPQKEDNLYQGCFVEYHPWDKKHKTYEEYYIEREKIIEDSKYSGIPLILITSIKPNLKVWHRNEGILEYSESKILNA